ncbi:MAG: hypothetical protein LBV28_00295 [Puniceicoccales bacterium]|nr:hypothetical protein [Puniceicoccales bacterium]
MNKKTADKTSPATAPTAPDVLAFATPDLADAGQGVVLVAHSDGKSHATVATFVVDVHCLGVRKVSLTELPLKTLLNQALPALKVAPVPSPVARGIVEGAAAYAKKLGFAAPETLAQGLAVFGKTPPTAPPFAFGQAGKPFYTQQSGDDADFVEMVLARLEKICGEGGFGYELDETGEDWLDGEEQAEAAEEE